ncbi:MAG: hypothetical protein WC985_10835 [Thermoplasmata archaeon]
MTACTLTIEPNGDARRAPTLACCVARAGTASVAASAPFKGTRTLSPAADTSSTVMTIVPASRAAASTAVRTVSRKESSDCL